jgi:hypothetical protein
MLRDGEDGVGGGSVTLRLFQNCNALRIDELALRGVEDE